MLHIVTNCFTDIFHHIFLNGWRNTTTTRVKSSSTLIYSSVTRETDNISTNYSKNEYSSIYFDNESKTPVNNFVNNLETIEKLFDNNNDIISNVPLNYNNTKKAKKKNLDHTNENNLIDSSDTNHINRETSVLTDRMDVLRKRFNSIILKRNKQKNFQTASKNTNSSRQPKESNETNSVLITIDNDNTNYNNISLSKKHWKYEGVLEKFCNSTKSQDYNDANNTKFDGNENLLKNRLKAFDEFMACNKSTNRRASCTVPTEFLCSTNQHSILLNEYFGKQTTSLLNLGKLSLALQYSCQKKLLILTVCDLTLTTKNFTIFDRLNNTNNNCNLDIIHQSSPVDNEAINLKNNYSLQIRLALLGKKVKHRTTFRQVVNVLTSTTFNETFAFNLHPEELNESIIRLRLYQKRLASGTLIGEAFFKTASIKSIRGASSNHEVIIKTPLIHNSNTSNISTSTMSLFPPLLSRSTSPTPSLQSNSQLAQNSESQQSNLNIFLNTRQNATTSNFNRSRRGSTVDDCGRFCSLPQDNGIPEVLISLCYLEDQSKVIVVIEKATGLNMISSTTTGSNSNSFSNGLNTLPTNNSKIPDTSLRVSILSATGTELAKHKSDVVKCNGTDSVEYYETAAFQVNRSDLEHSSILIQIYSHSGILRRKLLIGSICIGGCVGTDDTAARQHWSEMIQGMGITVDKWHHLMKEPHQFLQSHTS